MKTKMLILIFVCVWVNVELFSQNSDICYVHTFRYETPDVKIKLPKGVTAKWSMMRNMLEIALNSASETEGLNTVFMPLHTTPSDSYRDQLKSNSIVTHIDESNGDIVLICRCFRIVQTIKNPVTSITTDKVIIPVDVLDDTNRIDALINEFAHRFVIKIKDSENKEKLKKEFELLEENHGFQEVKKICIRIEWYLTALSTDSIRNYILNLYDGIESNLDKKTKHCNK